MSNIVVRGGLAGVAFLHTEIFLGSDVKIDSNLSESVRTRCRVGGNVLILNEATVVVGLHVTDISVILITDCKHGSTICLIQLCHAKGDGIGILRCDLYRIFQEGVGCGGSRGINQDRCLGL